MTPPAGYNSHLYDEDLAFIHVDGYGFHWSGAADAILAWLRQFGLGGGRVVDLGCGGGQWLGRLAGEGFEACGIDQSSSMIRLARRHVPTASIEEDFRRQQLTRYITTFRRLSDGSYRRDGEVHRLKIFSKQEVTGWLRRIGFRVWTRRSYGSYTLAARQSVFVCRKPVDRQFQSDR